MGTPESDLYHYLKDEAEADAWQQHCENIEGELRDELSVTVTELEADHHERAKCMTLLWSIDDKDGNCLADGYAASKGFAGQRVDEAFERLSIAEAKEREKGIDDAFADGREFAMEFIGKLALTHSQYMQAEHQSNTIDQEAAYADDERKARGLA